MNYRFRRATAGDRCALGELIYVAAEGCYSTSGYDLSIGGTRDHQVDVLARLTATEAPSWFHFSHFLVADHEGSAVAAVAAFHRPSADAFIEDALRQTGWSPLEIAILNARLEPIMCCFPPEPAASWTIEHVAVFPGHRRRGLAAQLIEMQLERGRHAGVYTSAHLDVFSTNYPAVRLYESLGFQEEAEFGAGVFEDLLERPPMWRMRTFL